MDSFGQDLRNGVRMLMKHPGFALVALLTLALGIGANTAIFSVVEAVLLRPLGYADAGRLVLINHDYPKLDLKASVSVPGYLHYRDHAKSFDGVAAINGWAVNLTGAGEPERLSGMTATPNFFRTLGVEPARGRVFLPEEDQAGRNRVVVLGDGLWRRLFGADPALVGKSITLNGESYTVVGIMPPGFAFGREFGHAAELWAPLTFKPEDRTIDNLTNEFLLVLARLRDGVPLKQAQAEMDTIADTLRRENMPEMDRSGWGLLLTPFQEVVVGDIRPALLVLLGAVGFVLLIACANVANLLLARAAARRKELAIRVALGAGRGRLLRQMLTEGVPLALLGGGLGLLLAAWGVNLLTAFQGVQIPRMDEINLNPAVLAFTFGLALLAGILFSLAPAFHVTRQDLQATLKEGGRTGSAETGGRLRAALVVAEMSLALVLLIGAGLLIKSFVRLQEVDPGFRPRNLLSMQLALPATRYSEPAQIATFYHQALERIQALPGVESAGATSILPLSGDNSSGSFQIEGRPVPEGQVSPHGDRWTITAGYLETMGIPVIRGRGFTEQDGPDAPRVALIDEAMAKKFWPDEDPVGKRITFEGTPEQPLWREIVGIVGHVKHNGLQGESRVQYYLPHSQRPRSGMYLAVRTKQEPGSVTSAIRDAIRGLDPDLPVFRVTTMERLVADSTARQSFAMFLLGLFAAVAMALAAVGLYGVMSYTVSLRSREIGIRMALGAQGRDVLRLVLGQGVRLIAVGIVLGVLAALGLTRLMTSLLFGVSATDPGIFTLISATLMGVALLACFVPTRRAIRVDPMLALRYE